MDNAFGGNYGILKIISTLVILPRLKKIKRFRNRKIVLFTHLVLVKARLSVHYAEGPENNNKYFQKSETLINYWFFLDRHNTEG